MYKERKFIVLLTTSKMTLNDCCQYSALNSEFYCTKLLAKFLYFTKFKIEFYVILIFIFLNIIEDYSYVFICIILLVRTFTIKIKIKDKFIRV